MLADNPFSDTPAKHKILVLAGHSGVATRSLSLLLTSEDDWCLKAFYTLDQDLAEISGPIAAVIKVRYRRTLRPRPVPPPAGRPSGEGPSRRTKPVTTARSKAPRAASRYVG